MDWSWKITAEKNKKNDLLERMQIGLLEYDAAFDFESEFLEARNVGEDSGQMHPAQGWGGASVMF